MSDSKPFGFLVDKGNFMPQETKQHDTIVVLDYGSQYSQLIARRIREVDVYCELFSWRTSAETIMALNPKGFILSGGPNSVYDDGAPTLPNYVLESGVPVLGICYGMQLLSYRLGGTVGHSQKREYGPASIEIDETENPLFHNWQLGSESDDTGNNLQRVWMSHGDKVEALAPSFHPIAHTSNSPFAAAVDPERNYYSVQFHPEVVHTPQGKVVLKNFVQQICGCQPDWTPANFIEEQISEIRKQVGDGRVVLGLSGGVDSAVAAGLLHKAIGEQLICIFVDHGMLRKNEALQVIDTFGREQGMNLIAVNAVE